jgi:hypothetical protein
LVSTGGAQIIDLPHQARPTEAIAESTAAKAPLAIYAHNTLSLDGDVEGGVWTRSADKVKLGPASHVKGDLWREADSAPAKKPGDLPGKKAGQDATVDASRVEWNGRVLGKQGFLATAPALPKSAHEMPTSKGRDLVITDDAKQSWADVRDVTVRKKGDLALPPGTYGGIAVTQGALVLGVSKATQPSHYVFRTLSVGPNAQIRLLGPVTISLASDSSVDGVAGNPNRPEWLDVRVSSGSFVLGNRAELHGFVAASDGAVQLKPGANLVGGIAAEDVTIAGKARVKAATRPLDITKDAFLNKALRLESRLPALADRHRNDYFPSTDYLGDTPHVLLAEGKRGGNAKIDQINDRLALLGALTDALVDTGFDRAVITRVRYRQGATHPGDVTNFSFSRSELDAALRFAGGMNNPPDNIRAITDSPLRLNIFAQYCEELAMAKQQAGR